MLYEKCSRGAESRVALVELTRWWWWKVLLAKKGTRVARLHEDWGTNLIIAL